ncbi:MAG: hypothetical protein ABII22_00600 [Candidatus Micrarchaeota archaeon]
MAKKKKGILSYIISFITLIFNIIKWIVVSIYKLIKFIIMGIVGLIKKGGTRVKNAHAENKRPKIKAEYDEFIELEKNEGNLKAIESKLCKNKSLIGIIFGSRGSGKSAIGMRILENVHAKTGRKTYALGFKKENLPSWVHPINSIKEVGQNSFLLADESGIEFSSRNTMSGANKLLSELLLISRHKDISVLFISQNSSNIEINTLRQADYLIFKRPSLLQLDFERKKIKEIYSEIKDKFAKYEENKGVCYIYSNEYQGFASNSLPSFWSENVSKSYRDKGK